MRKEKGPVPARGHGLPTIMRRCPLAAARGLDRAITEFRAAERCDLPAAGGAVDSWSTDTELPGRSRAHACAARRARQGTVAAEGRLGARAAPALCWICFDRTR